jgi:hypothetical protein
MEVLRKKVQHHQDGRFELMEDLELVDSVVDLQEESWQRKSDDEK